MYVACKKNGVLANSCVYIPKGIVLKDLCAIHANGGDLVKDPDRAGQLRMDKYDNLVNIFSYIKYSKQKYPSTKVDIDFTRILRVSYHDNLAQEDT